MPQTSLMNQTSLAQFAHLLNHIRAKNPDLNLAAIAESMNVDTNDVVSIFAAAKVLCERGTSNSNTAPEVLVKHWGQYQDSSPMTHKFEIEDELTAAGRIGISISQVGLSDDSPLWSTMEVSHDPHGRGRPVPAAHFALDGESYAFSLFQLEGTVLLVPEEGVEVELRPTDRGQTAYRISWKA